MRAVQKELEQSGILAPSGGRQWSRITIKNVSLEDTYLPRPRDGLKELVLPEVLTGLDVKRCYGITWFGKRRTRYAGVGKAWRVGLAPRGNWVAIPIDLSGAGLERGMVHRARAAVEGNRPHAKVGDRFWPLSGGVLYCAECGRAMICYRAARPGGGYRHYYRCWPGSTLAECPNLKSHRAEELEDCAAATFEHYIDDGKLLELYDQATEEHERRLWLRGNPERQAALSKRLELLAVMRRGYSQQQAEGLLTLGELRERLAEIEEETAQITGQLQATEKAAEEQREKQAARGLIKQLIAQGQSSLLKRPEKQRNEYKRIGTKFTVDQGGVLTLHLKTTQV